MLTLLLSSVLDRERSAHLFFFLGKVLFLLKITDKAIFIGSFFIKKSCKI
ncbi:hypothetical protein PROSTU_04797 [Providencia stuartii ATCC 25827]|uniref:Uncharacterized protein n=1 Tax=Providencia stuartii ATCC 25827 TaxID=471874 RepID=A0AA86YW74_PROST|nr:hypothetical protein PROSTU_04797 [Providencia stuartii ATCC 25827]